MLKIRILVISLFFFILFAGAITRLVDLQFYRASTLATDRDGRLSHTEQKAPLRGRILDAAGNIVAEDQPTQDLWLVPARVHTVNRRREVISNLEPLSADQIVTIAAAAGEIREFEYQIAKTSLTEANPLAAALAERLGIRREDAAGRLLDAALSGSPRSRDDLVQPRPAIDDVDFSFAMEIRSARANPYDDSVWKPLEVRTGGKRRYPAGIAMGHLTGTVGRLSAENYAELRGEWIGGEKKPGSGRLLLRDGRVFFDIRGDSPDGALSDEEQIIRLREVRRAGRTIKTQGYFLNETVGQGGLEQYYNDALRGRHRLQRLQLVMDPKSGRRVFSPKGSVESAVNGADIRLSLRMDVQQKAYEILTREMKKVSRDHPSWSPSCIAIMMDPNNGRIHALVSVPSYDPNTYRQEYNSLRDDPALPLLDRAIAGIYPPGSVVKPVVGLAALQEGAVMPGQRFNCDRVLMLAGARFTCLGRHGDVDLESALMHSCNIYFYHAGEELGSRKLYEWYRQFGLGHRTGIDLAGEGAGMLPVAAHNRRGWATGNTYHMSIGQGIAVTPIQIAVSFSALANARNGTAKIVRPHLLIPPETPPSTPLELALAEEARQLDLPVDEVKVDDYALAAARHGLWEVVQGRPETGQIGSGYLAGFPAPGGWLMELAGKTGTAEWSRAVNGRPVKGPDHVWFAAYAPFDKPELVVVVMLPESGGGGGRYCAPIAKELIRMWFNLPERIEYVSGEEALG